MMADGKDDEKTGLQAKEEDDLLIVVRQNDEELAEALLISGAQATEEILAVAASAGSAALVQLLIRYGVAANSHATPEKSALVQAAFAGHLSCVRMIMAANLDACRLSAVSKAIRAGHLDIVKAIIKLPEDAAAESEDRNTNLLGLAVDANQLHVVEFLLQECPQQMQFSLRSQWTSPISRAASLPESDILQALVRAGADLHTVNSIGNTPLMVACYNNRLNNAIFLADRMSRQDIDLKNDNDMTALHYAVSRGNVQIVKKLLRRGADPDLSYRDNLPPLHLAILGRQTEIACLLIDEGANLSICDEEGKNAMDYAQQNGLVRVVEKLREEGIFEKLPNDKGSTIPPESAGEAASDKHISNPHETGQEGSNAKATVKFERGQSGLETKLPIRVQETYSAEPTSVKHGPETVPDLLLELSAAEQWSSETELDTAIDDCESILAALGPSDVVYEEVSRKLLYRILQKFQMNRDPQILVLWQQHALTALNNAGFQPRLRTTLLSLDAYCWFLRHQTTLLSLIEYQTAMESARRALVGLPVSGVRLGILSFLTSFSRKHLDMDRTTFPKLRETVDLLQATDFREILRIKDAESNDGTARVLEFLEFVLSDLFKLDFQQTKSESSLESAIVYYKSAVYSDRSLWKRYPRRLLDLNQLLCQKYDLCASVEVLEEAVMALRNYLDLVKTNENAGAVAMNDLAHDLELLYGHRQRLEILDEACDLVTDAIKVFSKLNSRSADLIRGEMLTNLSNILCTRFHATGTEQFLVRSISTIQEALLVENLPANDRVTRMLNLAGLLKDEFRLSPNSQLLTRGLELTIEAVAVKQCSKPLLTRSLDVHCQILHSWLFLKPNDWPNLRRDYDKLVKIGKIVVGCCHTFAERSRALHNLATYLASRSARFHIQSDIRNAIALEASAVIKSPALPTLRALYISTMADHFSKLHSITAESDLLSVALKLLKVALALDPQNAVAMHNFAATTMKKWIAEPNAQELSLTRQRFEHILRQQSAPLLSRIRGGSSASLFALFEGDYAGSTELLKTILELLPGLYGRLSLLEDIQFVLNTLLNLPERVMCAFLGSGTSAEETLPQVESARGIFSHITMSGRDESISTAQGSTLNTRMDAGEMQSFAADGPIVDFSVTQFRSYVIIITRKEIKSMQLPELRDQDVIDAHAYVSGESRISKKSTREDFTSRSRKLKKLLLWLWRVAVKPTLDALDTWQVWTDSSQLQRRVRWISSSRMGALPLHAAGDCSSTSGENTMDRVTSSYIPNLRILRVARSRVAEPPLKKPASVRGLFVGTPESIELWPKLDIAAEQEVFKEACEEPLILLHPSAEEVATELGKSALCHFTCHGLTDPLNPANSSLVLGRETTDLLSIRRIIEHHSQSARLVYLSACSTAENAAVNTIAEGFHLAGAFMMAGFPNVVASLWEVDNDAASTITSRFYKKLGPVRDVTSLTSSAIAASLQNAVLEYRSENPQDVLNWATIVHYGI